MKQVLSAALLLLTVGCSQTVKTEPIEDLEKVLAFMDNNQQPADETPYVEVLDSLQDYCTEDRQYLAAMASEMVDNEAEAGYSATILDMLQTLNEDAIAGDEGRRVQCQNYFLYHAQSLKEASE